MPIETPSIYYKSISAAALNHPSGSDIPDSPGGGDNLGQTKEQTLGRREMASSRMPIETPSISFIIRLG